MYLSYQLLRNLAPQSITPAQQRAADEQLGRIAATLARRARADRHGAACKDSGAGNGGRSAGRISKGDRELCPAALAG